MLLDLDGFRTYYEEHGSGEAVILIHGLGASSRMWQKVVGPLAERVRVIMYDLRGLGQSTTPPPPYTLSSLVADLHGLVEGLALERFTIVGHSLGGAVAFGYGIEHPNRPSGLVCVSAPSVTAVEQKPTLVAMAETAQREGMQAVSELHARNGLPEGFAEAQPEDTALYKSILSSGDPVAYSELCGVIERLDIEAELGRIQVPVLLIEGELDRVVSAERVRATAALIPGSEYVELAGCGHIVPLERPDVLIERIPEFVTRLEQLSPR
jgi:pimeloyl-ACP methyl ester carboxylesterase